MTPERIKELKLFANTARRHIVEDTHAAKSGHPGGSLGAIDYMTYLYNEEMRVDPKNPDSMRFWASWAFSRKRTSSRSGKWVPICRDIRT